MEIMEWYFWKIKERWVRVWGRLGRICGEGGDFWDFGGFIMGDFFLFIYSDEFVVIFVIELF